MESDSWGPEDIRREGHAGRWIVGKRLPDGGKQPIDARVLGEVVRDPQALVALRLRGFHIRGSLECADVTFEGELALESCETSGDIDLTGSNFGAVRFVRSKVNGSIRASSISVSSSLVLDGTTVTGGVFAPDASIDGRVSCDEMDLGGASIEGFQSASLLLEGATIKGRLSARRVQASHVVTLNGARIAGQLDLSDARLQGNPVALRVENVRVADVAHIKSSEAYGAFRAAGQVLLAGSEFAGGLNCTGIAIGDPEKAEDAPGPVLDGRNAKIGGEFFLNHGTIVGGVLLTAAEVQGQFNLSGTKIRGGPEAAVDAQGIRVGTDVWLDNCFEASSAVLLDRATIGGTLNGVAGHFTAKEDGRYRGIALSLASASIGGSLVLADEPWTAERRGWSDTPGFLATGTVVLTDTHVARRLEGSGGIFDGRGADALKADGIRVDAQVRLGDGAGPGGRSRFQAFGTVRLSRAAIAGSLDLTGARLTVQPRHGGDLVSADSACALDASHAHVGDRLVLRQLSDLNGRVSLIGTQVATLSDDPSYWRGRRNVLELDDLSYRLLDRERLDWREGRDWLERLHHYRDQPYLELARVERAMGRTRDARRLNIERHKARLARQRPPWSDRPTLRARNRLARGGDRTLGLLIGWGYARWRLAPMWTALLILAAILFQWAGHHNVLRPSHLPVIVAGRAPESSHCAPDYPCFESFTYSLDVILPVIDLKQRDNWYADGRTTRGKDVAIATLGLTLLGWGFATLLAASFTNILKRE
jgi:hypothetical protein